MKISSYSPNVINYRNNNTSAYQSRNSLSLQSSPVDYLQISNKTNEISFTGIRLGLGIKTRIKWLLNFLGKLSEYDTPEIKKLRQEEIELGLRTPHTIKDNSPARQALRKKIAQHFFDLQPNVRAEKNCFVVLGLPGFGKSTFSEIIANNQKAIHIDHDAIKFEIPEFKENQRMQYVVDEEVGLIWDDIFSTAMEKNHNIVIEDCGISLDRTLNFLKKLKKAGYKVHLRIINLPEEKAFERTMARFKETGRFTDPFVYRRHGHKYHHNCQKLISEHSDYFESYGIFSSDVERGEPFELIEGKNLDSTPLPESDSQSDLYSRHSRAA